MEPVLSNLTNRTCGDSLSSSCVIVPIDIPCLDLCKGSATVTDALYQLGNKLCTSNSVSPCYTGSWVNLSSIPLSGTSPAGSIWTIGSLGTGGENIPMYKWSKDGDLELRGSFEFRITPNVTGELFCITLGTISGSCFPPNWNASQSHLLDIDAFGENGIIDSFFKATISIEYPTGQLKFCISFQSPKLMSGDFTISLGAIRFNLA